MPTRAAFPKRSRLALLVIVAAVAVLCLSLWVNEGPLWQMVMLRTICFESAMDGHAVRGWVTVYRWGQIHDRL